MDTIEIVKENKVECQSVGDGIWHSSVGTVKTCSLLANSSSISEQNTTISSLQKSVRGLWLQSKKILFLLIQIAAAFPYLSGYRAIRCSTKEISQRNFEGLYRLKFLDLGSNEIEKISSDTFNDLKDLQVIGLSEKTSI